jgi:hypothetical protein
MRPLPSDLDAGEHPMTRRRLAWAKALSDMRADRATPRPIREELLRVRGLSRPRGLSLSAWRGRSGRRYVVSVHPFRPVDLVLDRDAVILAVRRPETGPAAIVGLHAMTDHPKDLSLWRMLDRAHEAGANELHLHRLAETKVERAAIVADLSSET